MKKKLNFLGDWMKIHNVPPRIIFLILGILSTIWFLVRVIPKPSRATHPCIRVTAPIMSGFVVYLLTLSGITVALRKAKQRLNNARYLAAGTFILVALCGIMFSVSQGIHNSYAGIPLKIGPDDGPNQPFGKALGENPGRVVWIWNPEATNENCKNDFDTKDLPFKPENTNGIVVGNMLQMAVKKLTGKSSVADSWNVLFRYHNNKKLHINKGYTKGEKIFLKINQNISRGLLSQENKNNGYYYPETLKPEEKSKKNLMGSAEAGPYIVLEVLRELVNEAGVNQKDIAVGDPIAHIYGHNYDAWFKEFPDVVYTDRITDKHGRTLINPTSKELVFYSDKTQKDKLYDIIENADYLINLANFKPHTHAGISLTAKNHYGSQGSGPSAEHLHYSLIAPRGEEKLTNGGYHKYRALVDLMGSKYLGQNTMLSIVDGLFGGGANQSLAAVKYFMPPFNNDWCNSIFLSQDQVALESVCFDFLRAEWNGINRHNPVNNKPESKPNSNGVDDYLHQAADSSNWPAGIIYDPDNSGRPISSLGIHEHWNNSDSKQYSRNLGLPNGIELVAVPENLVKSEVPAEKKNN